MRRGFVALWFAGFAFAQGAAEFEVASIRPAARQEAGRRSVSLSDGRGNLDYKNASLLNLVMKAYRVQEFQVNGPPWLDDHRYDIAARYSPDADRELSTMLRTLLEQRFGMKAHMESKEGPAYALTVSKGGVKAAAAKASTGTYSRSNNGRYTLEAEVPLASFAEYLSGVLNRPVIDETGLTGPYQLKLEWINETAAQQDGPSIFTVLEEQLGLKLTSARRSVPVVVVDQINQQPTEN